MTPIQTHNLSFEPFLHEWGIVIFLGAMLVFILSARHLSWGWRLLAFSCTFLFFLNPTLNLREGIPAPPHIIIFIDNSPSQKLNKGANQAAQALEKLTQKIKQQKPNAKISVIRTTGEHENAPHETHLFDAMQKALSEPQSLSAIILMSDGLIHDVPTTKNAQEFLDNMQTPLHLILTGEASHYDRRLIIDNPPAFALKGQSLDLTLRAETKNEEAKINLSIFYDGEPYKTITLMANTKRTLTLPVRHTGKNLYRFMLEAHPQEDYLVNNEDILEVMALQDSVRVLLLSGAPSVGGRVLRDILKADSSVDLVHLIILRSGPNIDAVPEHERALIDFPERKVFSEQIGEFDLIIFDNYQKNNLVKPAYAAAIERHVKKGASLLMIEGDPTPTLGWNIATLKNILPLKVTKAPQARQYKPELTIEGEHHPITRNLTLADTWLTLTLAQIKQDHHPLILMQQGTNPILAIEKKEEGRVAQLMSNNFWLEERGWTQKDKPASEFLTRLIHWLLKNPALEEEKLTAHIQNKNLIITRETIGELPAQVTITDPHGTKTTLPLIAQNSFMAEAHTEIEHHGIYHISDGALTTFAGTAQGKEYQSITPSMEPLRPLLAQGIAMRADNLAEPQWQRNAEQGEFILLERHIIHPHRITSHPLLPAWLALFLILVPLITAWIRESRR